MNYHEIVYIVHKLYPNMTVFRSAVSLDLQIVSMSSADILVVDERKAMNDSNFKKDFIRQLYLYNKYGSTDFERLEKLEKASDSPLWKAIND